MRERGAHDFDAWVLGATDPLAALQDLARHWRRELGCPVSGSPARPGKTSVKDICASLLPVDPVHASPENFNTEIGLPLAILGAPADTEALVLEMGMRGRGPDRRAGRDRRARRRRDHQRRPGPRRAARQRSRRSPRPRPSSSAGCARGAPRSSPRSRARSSRSPGASAPGLLRFGDGRRRLRARVRAERGGGTQALVVTPAGEQRVRVPVPRGPQPRRTRWRRSPRASRSGCRSTGWPRGRRG